MAKRLRCWLGKSPSHGASLKQAFGPIDDVLAGTLQMFQGRAVPWGGINQGQERQQLKTFKLFTLSKSEPGPTVPGTDCTWTICHAIALSARPARRLAFRIRL